MKPYPGRRPSASLRWLLTILVASLLSLVAWSLWAHQQWGVSWGAAPAAMSPAEARQQELLERNIALAGDAELAAEYRTINDNHFHGGLPPIAIRWEPALDDVAALASNDFSLEGMVGRVGNRMIMLLNPKLRADRPAFERALCHEMVHVYLFTIGDKTTRHDAAFQAVLRRLSNEGAFKGLPLSDGEKTELRAWLDAESARIDADERALAAVGAGIERERAALDEAITAFNVRNESGAADGSGGPSADEAQALEARRERFNQLVLETNERLARGRQARARFNAEVARYNLTLVYPDGIDEDARVATKSTQAN